MQYVLGYALCKPENMLGTTSILLFGDDLNKKAKDLLKEQKFQKVTAGVMKGQRKPYSNPHPYRGTSRRQVSQVLLESEELYKEARWSRSRAPATATRPFFGSGERPFLERIPRQPRQPQGNKKPLAPQFQTQWKC